MYLSFNREKLHVVYNIYVPYVCNIDNEYKTYRSRVDIIMALYHYGLYPYEISTILNMSDVFITFITETLGDRNFRKRDEILRMHKKGFTMNYIVKALGTTKNYVRYIINQYKKCLRR